MILAASNLILAFQPTTANMIAVAASQSQIVHLQHFECDLQTWNLQLSMCCTVIMPSGFSRLPLPILIMTILGLSAMPDAVRQFQDYT